LLDRFAQDIIEALYLRSNKPGIASVCRNLEQFSYRLKYDIVWCYIKYGISEVAKTFYRMEYKAFHNKFEPYIKRNCTLMRNM